MHAHADYHTFVFTPVLLQAPEQCESGSNPGTTDRYAPAPPKTSAGRAVSPYMSGKAGLYSRHEEIRLALRFFLQSFYKNKQQGLVPDPAKVLHDFARYKGISPIVDRLSTRPRQVQHEEQQRR